MLPEYFNASLMSQFYPHASSDAEAVRSLAEYTERIREYITDLAISHNINVVAGSMPCYTITVCEMSPFCAAETAPGMHNTSFTRRPKRNWIGASRAATS